MADWLRRSLIALFVLLSWTLALQQSPGAPAAIRSLPAIRSRTEFDALARVTDLPYPLPHLLFVIDRQRHNRIYYVNSKRYLFHRDFINSSYLSLERGQKFFADNFLKANRRFILGTIAYRSRPRRWTFEFWEGDLISTAQIRLASRIINRTFFQPVAFRPNSLRQEQESARIPHLARVLEQDIEAKQDYQPLNLAAAIGRLRILPRISDPAELRPTDLPVLAEVPVTLPPVAGLIAARPSTPLSHVNLLAKSWGVPSAYIRNAAELLRPYEGEWVSFVTKRSGYAIHRASPAELQAYQARVTARRNTMTPRADLSVHRIADLREQRATSVTAYGAKSANLGELMQAHVPDIQVPEGFTLPFFAYDQFMKENHFDTAVTEMTADARFGRDADYRRVRLAALRERMQHGRMNPSLQAEVLRRTHARFRDQGLFVRSSTNAEDLPGFNGAGLYTTVPNARGDDAILEAIKTVWASVWNYPAYEERERAGIDHAKVFMAVLLQEGIDADSAGVMITTDPYDPENREAISISAKRGLGIKVVEGQKVAEQILFNPITNAVRVLTRSAEDTLLQFDARGGVREVPITGERPMLTDALIRRLARAAVRIQRVFHSQDQDIEWALRHGQIYIVQSRPFISSG